MVRSTVLAEDAVRAEVRAERAQSEADRTGDESAWTRALEARRIADQHWNALHEELGRDDHRTAALLRKTRREMEARGSVARA